MATFQTNNGNGSTTAFTFTFPYINTDDVKASINDVVTTAFTIRGSTLTFSTAPASGNNNVKIFRETNNTTIQADFQSGSALRAVDLNDNFTQVLYVTQEATDGSTTAVSDSAAAVTTANTASTNATNAVNTANTASANATTALNTANSATTAANAATSASNTATSTANTADTNASAAVVTANAASATATTAATNASNAVTTSNTASSTANTASTNASNAVTTANTAATNAANAVTTANAASTTANTALTNSRESDGSGGFNTAISVANAASSTATTASTNASSAVTTANTASTNASTAVTTANSATATANAAASTVASAVFYTPVANFASFPGSPSNQDRIEVTNSTGLESQSIVSGIPSGFVGSSDLTMRLQYNSSTSKWEFQQYFAEDPEARYMPKQGGTMTGLLTLSGAPTANLHAASKAYVDAANTTQDTTVATNTSNISTNATAIATKMATAGGTFTGNVSFDDNVILKGDGTNGSGELTLNCENNSHGIKIKGPPHSAGANYTLTLPNDTGTNGQALITDGSGVSSWSTIDLASKLPLAGGTLTGDLTLSGNPTAANHAANKAYVDTEVAGIVDSAPGTLDTLNELAAALGDDPNFATTVTNSIGTKLPLAGGTLTGDLTISSGRLLVGTTNAVAFGSRQVLAVANGTTGGVLSLYNSTTATANTRISSNPTGSEINDIGIHAASTNGSIIAYTNNDTEAFRIDPSGRLLLGTTTEGISDGDNLTIADSGACGITLRSGTTSGGAIYFSDATSGSGEYAGYIEYLHNNNALRLASNGEERLRIDASGNVFIGGTTASSADIALNANGSATFAGNITSGRIDISTDEASTAVANFRNTSTGAALICRTALGNDGFRVENNGNVSVTGSMTVSGTGQYTGGQRGAVTTLTDAGAIYPNFAAANNFTLTIAGNRTIHNPTNQTAGQHGVIRINQDGTGGRVPAFASNWKFPGGTAPTFSTAANAQDLLAYYVAASGTILAQLITDLK